jgi:hypothetical protein
MTASAQRHLTRGFMLSAFVLLGAGSVSAQTSEQVLSAPPITGSLRLAPSAESPFTITERALTTSVVPSRPSVNFSTQQTTASGTSGVGFGILGMVSRTSWRADDIEDFFDDKIGWGAGLWIGGNRNGRVGVVGEFIYLSRGDDDFKTRALQVPLVLHFNIGQRSRESVSGYIVAGPSFTFNLTQESLGLDISENFNDTDIGILAGAGIEFFRIGIEARGNWGVKNLDQTGNLDDLKTFSFEFLGRFAFN